MKIWHSHGTEHSMNLVMLGRFKSEADAEAIERMLNKLKDELRENLSVGDSGRRYPEAAMRILNDLKCFSLTPPELEQFLFDVSVRRDGSTLRLWTDESEVSAFIKLMVDGGAKVEVFSNHHHEDESDTAE